jgi:hypothetical protein
MSKSRPLLAAALVAATLGGAALTAAPVVFAQSAPAAADQTAPMPPRHHAERPLPGQFIEGRIAFLRTELKVTPQQQPLFDKLADEMRTTAKAMAARHEAMQAEFKKADHRPVSSLERLERRSAMMKEAAASSDRFLATYKPFYESLSDTQKKTADLLFARFAGGMGGPGGHHGMMRRG